jgi:hypothetical protein
MPEKETIERARKDAEEGKAPSTQAGEFVREEIHHVREGKHGARSTKQAIAIGLSKARRAGVKLPLQSGGASKTHSKMKRGNAPKVGTMRAGRQTEEEAFAVFTSESWTEGGRRQGNEGPALGVVA